MSAALELGSRAGQAVACRVHDRPAPARALAAIRRDCWDGFLPSSSDEDSCPEGLASREGKTPLADQLECAYFQQSVELFWVNQDKDRLQAVRRGESALAGVLPGLARQLQHDGERAALRHQRERIVEAAAGSRVLEDQSRMDQFDWGKLHLLFGQIDTVQLKPRQPGIPLADYVQIARIDVQPNHALRQLAVDAIQAVSARNSKHGDRSRKAEIEGLGEEIGERLRLPNLSRRHVPFVVGQWNVEPGIGHKFMLSPASGHGSVGRGFNRDRIRAQTLAPELHRPTRKFLY